VSFLKDVPLLGPMHQRPKLRDPEPAPPTPPASTDESTRQAADAAARAELEEQERRRRRGTIVTSPMGVLGEAPVTRKSLLGT
jgi:hypothetical protein